MIDLASHSRVWIFQADRFLNEEEVAFVKKEMEPFLKSWAAHGNDLYGGFDLEMGLFLIIAADEQRAPASGCSIDALMRKVQEMGKQIRIDFLNRLKVAYEDPSTTLHLVTLEEFKTLIKNGEVDEKTKVYNNMVQTLGDFNTSWRTALSNSWHKNLMQTV